MITGIQMKMARAALGWGLRELAKEADVSTNTLTRLENGLGFQSTSLAKVKAAFEAAGIEFLHDNGARLKPKQDQEGKVI